MPCRARRFLEYLGGQGDMPHKRELKQEVYKFPISKKLKKFTITTLFRVK